MEEDDTLELSIDPFAEVPLEETLQAKAPLIERLQTAKKKAPKAPPEERLRLQAVQKRSPQVGEEDVQASKPLVEGRKKSPALQEKSKQSSQRRCLITEEDDKMLPCNIDPFSEEVVDKNGAVESDQSSQENCF